MDQSPKRRILQLVRSFPTLKAAFGNDLDWAAEQLDQFACQAPGSGARHAAQFVLAVWNNGEEWNCGRFDVVDAMASWDQPHRNAFLAWATDPWWA